MSTLNERPGSLIFPIEKYKDSLRESSDFRFTFMHHPINWYCQDTYHEFRRLIQSESSVVFSGHEHVSMAGESKRSDGSGAIYIEGDALVPHEDNLEPGFSVLSFDLEDESILFSGYKKKESRYENVSQDKIYFEMAKRVSPNEISPHFLSELNDPGANFSRPNKENLSISDIYVNPEIECKKTGDVIDLDMMSISHRKIYFSGDEQAGKTKLLHRIFLMLHSNGLAPVYVDAVNLKRTTRDGIEKLVDKSASDQYCSAHEFGKLCRSERAILLDNYEVIGGLRKGVDSVFSYINDNFDTVVVSCDSLFISASGFSVGSDLDCYDGYSIKDFGCVLRHKLIEKWHSCGRDSTLMEFERKVHLTEKTISTVLGRNLIPSRPLYLLTLLQSTAAPGKEELQNSGMSYYYQYLITKSLEEAGVSRGDFDEVFNYLSNLAWFYMCEECDLLDFEELRKFNRLFSEKFTTVDLEKQLKVLTRARILFSNGGYRFSYPYIKYFFLGKYFADHIDDEEVVSIINECCKNLSAKDNSNVILFLTHHKNSDWVVDTISDNLRGCFREYDPLDFELDSDYFNTIVGSVSEVVISELDIDENQKARRRLIERQEEGSGVDSGVRESGDPKINDLFNLLRSSEVLGQILKNYYGSITRVKKYEYLVEAVDAPLRLLGFIMRELIDDPDRMVDSIEERVMELEKDFDKDKVRKVAAGIISEFIGAICTGVIAKSAESIASDKLREDFHNVVQEKDKSSYDLVQAAIWLMSPSTLNLDKMKRVVRRLDGSHLALKVFQNLALYHIHMFHTSEADKQSLGRLVNINLKGIRSPVK